MFLAARISKRISLAISDLTDGAGRFSSGNLDHRIPQRRPGSLLVTFTDGISEAANDAGEEFSEERLIDVVLQRRDASPGAICSAIVDAARQWSESQEQLDDMTVIALKTA